MDGDFIVTASVVLDKTMSTLGHRDHVLARARDAAVLTVGVVAAKYCQHHLERALPMLHRGHYLSGPLSISRCNRRLHRLADWLGLIVETLGALFAPGEAFLSDSMPLPVCRRARARRSRKLSGRDCCGYCAAQKERFCGWRRHLVCTTDGVPVAFDLVPGGLHDLTPIHELTYGLPTGAAVYGDKAAILTESGVRLVPLRKANMRFNLWADKLALRAWRKRIEALFSQLEAMGVQRLRPRQPRPPTHAPRLPPRRHYRQCRLAITVIDSSANAVTIASAAGTIDGAATKALSASGQVARVVSDGQNWFVV